MRGARSARIARRVAITAIASASILVLGAIPAADAGPIDHAGIPQVGGGSSWQQSKTSKAPQERDDAKLLRLHNTERSRSGVPTLTTDSSLTSFARRRAAEMAQKEMVWHSRSLPAGDRWYIVGENVGCAETVDEVFDGFVTSRSHRANVFRPGFRAIGIGVAERGGAKYVAVVYGQPWPATAPAVATAQAASGMAPAAMTKPTPRTGADAESQTVTVLVRLHELEQ